METLDQSTKTFSENLFMAMLELEGRRAERYGYYFSILIVQIDQPHDHSSFPTLVELIRQSVRSTDLIGRMKNQRLSLILHEAEPPGALGVGKRICNRVASHTFDSKNASFQQTVSLGGACFPTHIPDIEGLFLTADRMLYSARMSGGNRVNLPGM